jgi:hypothetical protein
MEEEIRRLSEELKFQKKKRKEERKQHIKRIFSRLTPREKKIIESDTSDEALDKIIKMTEEDICDQITWFTLYLERNPHLINYKIVQDVLIKQNYYKEHKKNPNEYNTKRLVESLGGKNHPLLREYFYQ